MKQKSIFKKKYFELTGCVHVHTKYSYDCKIPVSKVLKAAHKNGLDYLTINDHSTYDTRKDVAIKNEKDIFVIVGTEVNDQDKNNHYLVFNSEKMITKCDAKKYIKEYKEDGAICFAAHPIDNRKTTKFRSYIWTDKTINDFDGMEIWNFLSSWIGNIVPKLNGIFFVLFPTFCVKKPFQESLEFWDELNNDGNKKSAIGSVDAHSEKIRKFGINFKFLTHKYLFGTVRTNVLINLESKLNNKTILMALKNGNSYIVNYKLGNPHNFFGGISNQNENAIFGEEIKFSDNLYFYFRLPKIARVKIFRNGKKMASRLDEKGKFKIEKKGNYRLEISRFGYSWIFTNNIYVV